MKYITVLHSTDNRVASYLREKKTTWANKTIEQKYLQGKTK